MEELYGKLKKIKVRKAPIKYEGRKNIQWVKPKLICEVRYLEMSKDKILRAPAFLRMRKDKRVKECEL